MSGDLSPILGDPQSGFLLVGAAKEEVAKVREAMMTGVVGIFIVIIGLSR